MAESGSKDGGLERQFQIAANELNEVRVKQQREELECIAEKTCLEATNVRLSELKADAARKRATLKQVNESIEVNQRQVDTYRKHNEQLERTLADTVAQNAIHDAHTKRELKRHTGERDDLQQRTIRSRERITELSNELEREASPLLERLEELKLEDERLRRLVDDLTPKTDASLDADERTLRAAVDQKQAELTRLAAETDKVRRTQATVRQRIAELDSADKQRTNERRRIEEERAELAREIERAENERKEKEANAKKKADEQIAAMKSAVAAAAQKADTPAEELQREPLSQGTDGLLTEEDASNAKIDFEEMKKFAESSVALYNEAEDLYECLAQQKCIDHFTAPDGQSTRSAAFSELLSTHSAMMAPPAV